jgi:hypothetical protein
MASPPPSQPSSQPTRRGFLKKGLAGGALLALGGAGFLASRGTRMAPPPKEPLQVLDATGYAIVHALCERLVSPRPGTPTVDQVNTAYNVDAILTHAGADVRKEVKQLLGLFENGLAGFLFGGRTHPFTQLSPEEQDEVLREWRDSRLMVRRTGYQALRSLALAAYYSSELSWPAVGYPGPPQGFHQPDAKPWKGGGEPRPEGNGVYHPESEEQR